WYAPLTDYQLSARFRRPEPEVSVSTSLLLTFSDQGADVRGEFALQPTVEKLFAFDFSAPAGWTVDTVSDANGARLKFDVLGAAKDTQRIHVTLPRGVAAGEVFKVQFHAATVPADWLDTWQKRDMECPVFAVVGAKNDQGILAVKADDDIVVDPGKTEGLNPLYGDEKARFGLEKLDAQVALAYRQQPYSAIVSLRRPKSWVTARTYQFFKVQPEAVQAHYELQYFIAEARTSLLAFTLPESTPVAVNIEGLDGVKYKEFRSEIENGLRHWTVELAERRLGRVRLKVTLTQKLPSSTKDKKSIALKLPLAEAQGVTYQSGLVAVEGSPELDVRVAAGHPREVDVGELAAADYTPGKQLLGAYAFIGNPPAMAVDITRSQDYAIPASLVQKAELTTALSIAGVSQTSAYFQLKTKDNYLHIALPVGSTLWSVMIDGQPGRPQRDADGVLVVLPPGKANHIRQLRIAFETPVSPLAMSGRMQLNAPLLKVRRSEDGVGLDVPVADIQWKVRLPDGYYLIDSDGTVHTTELTQDQPLKLLGAALYAAGGGLFEYGLLSPAVQSARESARRSSEGYEGYSASSAPPAAPALPEKSIRDGSKSMDLEDSKSPAGEFAESPVLVDPFALPPASKPAPEAIPMPPTPQSGLGSTSGGTTSSAGGKYFGKLPGKQSKIQWLETHSSLDISLNVDRGYSTSGRSELATFHSLGEGTPSLDIQVVDSRRIGYGAWGVGLLVALVGITLTRRPRRTKFIFVLSVILLSILLPLIVPPTLVLSRAFDAAFVAAGLLVFYYLAAGLVRSALRRTTPARKPAKAFGVIASGLLCLLSHVGAAQADEPADRAPLKLPDDAILIPYDPGHVGGIEAATRKADRLLVPLDRYIQLWNQVHPNDKLQLKAQPAEYALAGGAFTATLSDGDTLNLMGHIDIELFVDRPVEIPLALSGIVLSRAEVEGKPARLRIVAAVPYQAKASAMPAAVADGRAVLQLEGQGRKRLMLELQLPITKSGGWRSVKGKIPAAPATVLQLKVPNRGTEVCSSCGSIIEQRETSKDNEQRDVPVAADGVVDLRWRGHVDDASADPTLTVESDVLADVREDAWRIAWQAKLQFARQQRESFELSVPGDYLVERVLGANVRGWEVAKAGDRQRIDVTLLAPATGQETFTINMSRTPATPKADGTKFEVPKVQVTGANLYRGTLTIRRSVLLDVQVASLSGLQQVGLPANVQQLASGMPESTLNVKALAAYRFGDVSFSAALSVRPLPDDVSCTAQTIVRLETPDVELASHLVFQSPERPVYQVRVALPKGLVVTQVTSPSDMLYSVAAIDGRDVLSVNFSSGQLKTFSVDIAGRMKDVVADGRTALPQLQLLNVRQQQGEIVVQAPPGFDVRAQDLADCNPLLLSEVNSWLDPAHRALAGLALRYRTGDYGGQLALAARSPHIQAVSVTNVRYTPSAIEQTVHVQFDIKDAGIRQLSFLLPEALRQARIASNRAIRHKSIEPAANRPGWVRVRLVFQELQMGLVNVEATHDQLLTQEAMSAPIPVVETGKTNYRYIALENSGRDEVVVARQQNVEPVARRQSAKQTLDSILGTTTGEAFVVQEGAGDPLLEWKTTPRAAEQTAGAKIRLAETAMIVDGNGGYRAEQVFYVDNRTEQVLSLELPAGARLWTVRVAGQLVKPVRAATAGSSQVQIPLVRTMEGDRDYKVEIKYGGQLPSFQPGSSVSFPIAKTINIQVEQTHVKLQLPETHDWFDFGGTATKVEDGSVLEVGRQEYGKNQTQRIIRALQREDVFTQTRGREASEQIKAELEGQIRTKNTTTTGGDTTGRSSATLGLLQQQAVEITSELKKLDERQKTLEGELGNLDNRRRLSGNLGRETANPAVADLPALKRNWKSASPEQPPAADGRNFGFNESWYAANGLKSEPAKSLPGQDYRNAQTEELQRRGDKDSLDESRIALDNQRQSRQQPQAGPGQGMIGGQGPGISQGQQPAGGGEESDFFAKQKPQAQQLEKAQQSLEESEPQQQESSGKLAWKYQQRLAEQNKVDGEVLERAGKDDNENGALGDRKVVMGSGLGPFVTKQPEADKGTFSLDVTLPERGQSYYFTAVRGAPEITARAVPDWLLQRLIALAWVVGALLIGLLVYWGFRRASLGGASSGTLSTLLIVVGILSIVTGILPIYGLVALIVGIVAAIRGRRQRVIASA
ncbi:MAG: hypothetical protein K8T91_21470, partial [Planctomycetes bacterium]|nr:hypothetical protein [Planctomycetota bacterium]